MPVPTTLAAGTTLLFSESYSGYLASSGSLSFALNLEGRALPVIPATADGEAFVIAAAFSVTGAWVAGRYRWAESYTRTSDSLATQVATGFMQVTPNLFGTRKPSIAEAQLEAIDNAILACLSNPAMPMSVSFSGQSSSFRSLGEMMDAADRLRARVNAELRAQGLSDKGGARTIVTRFVP